MIDWMRSWPKWVKITVPIVAGLMVLSALAPKEEADQPDEKPASAKTAETPEPPKSNPQPVEKTPESEPKPVEEPKPKGLRTQIKDAIESSGLAMEENKVRDVLLIGQAAHVTLETPKGGFNGPSVDDLNDQAAGAFQAIYNDTDFKGTTFLFFEGGLVDAKTGQDAPDAQTGSFAMRKGEARQIDWSDEDRVRFGIDWSLFRTGASPALRGA